MRRSSEFRGLAVVDLDAAEKIGQIDEVILDPEAVRVAGLVVSSGQSLFGGGKQLLIPASSVYAVGADAVTVRSARDAVDDSDLAALPRLSKFVDRKMVTFGGKLIGSVSDVLIDIESGRIVGYAFDEASGRGGLEGILGGRRERPLSYVQADADLRVGPDLIVVPDDAIVHGEGSTTDTSARGADVERQPQPSQVRWSSSDVGTRRTTSDATVRGVSESDPGEPTRVLRTMPTDSDPNRSSTPGETEGWQPRADRESEHR